MRIGMVGLGRMGANMARRLMRGGHECVVYDRRPDSVAELVREGALGADSLAAMAARMERPRAVWLMTPAGDPTEETVAALSGLLAPDDTIIDGGNTYYKDDLRRAAALRTANIHYVDVGTSGGLWGLERGYCLMIGGDSEAVGRLEPVFRTLAPGSRGVPPTPGRPEGERTAEEGFLHCGTTGAGHFVKMIHNGIEYGLMHAYAEGFDILTESREYQFRAAEIAEVWRRGSVIGSWLLDLAAAALAEDESLAGYSGFVEDSGEGRWALTTAIEEGVSADVLAASLFRRFRSRKDSTFAERVLSAMRHKFGGHIESPADR